jgi:hypothetical protein
MAESPDSKDKALAALDFIINVLKEHEQNLDKSIDELATITEQIGEIDTFGSKMEKIDEKINNLQKEVTSLIGYLSNQPKETLSTVMKKQEPQAQVTPVESSKVIQSEPPAVILCKQWEDFQAQAVNAQTLSFSIKEEEKLFQVDALKGNQLITYSGILPNFSSLLKIWLSKYFSLSEQSIFEGKIGFS